MKKSTGVKKTCNSELCCKATAKLEQSVASELQTDDKPLKEILDAQAQQGEEDDDEEKDDETK